MKANILIVEDESIVAQDLQFTLEDLGYGVPAIANTGESAIGKVVEYQPDLILMDIRIIGEMDGINTASIILERFDIPVVYLTAHADKDTLARAKLTSPYGYIIKPFVESELHTTIEIALYKYQQEQQLKKNVRWLQTVLNSISDGVIAADRQGDITFLNPAAETLTCLSFQQVLGKKASEVFVLTDAQSRHPLDNPLDRVLKTKDIFQLPADTLLVKEDGEEVYISGSVSPIVNYRDVLEEKEFHEDLAGTVMIFQDVTEKKAAVENLHHRAFYDSLTNIPNRDWFTERLNDAVERVDRNPDCLFAVLFLDLDDFKKINDSLGHPVGDRLLIAVARRLERSLRSCDTVARLGGDEFGIILESLDSVSESCRVARRIQQELAKPFVIDRNTISTNCSIGLVTSSIKTSIDNFIRNADIAMYRAKEKGKGCYEIFDETMHEEVMTSFRLENELLVAISQNQLVVHYQPIISLLSQEISGFEALVRWNHPTKGLLYPDEFITVAEETGIITKVDLWVLRQVCKQLAVWQQRGTYSPAVTVSVNLSSRHFVRSDFVDRVTEIITDMKIEASRIKLEITETTLIENTIGAKNLFSRLKELGFTLSLDDFGTGYSSLSYLQQFPLDVLKIDRCFVRELHRNSKNATITKALIEIAHQLGLTVIAEGVETEAELSFLSQNYCDNIQGYYFSPPLAIQDLEQFELPSIPC